MHLRWTTGVCAANWSWWYFSQRYRVDASHLPVEPVNGKEDADCQLVSSFVAPSIGYGGVGGFQTTATEIPLCNANLVV